MTGFWLRILAAWLVCWLAPGAAAQDTAAADAADREWSATLGLRFESLTSTGTLLFLSGAAIAAAWSWEETDERQGVLRDALDGGSWDLFLDIGNVYGSGWVVGGASLSALAASRITGNDDLLRFGVDLSLGYLYAGLASTVIKVAVNRQRPAGGPYSFPSGHTTSAFSTVPVIWHHAGWVAGVGGGVMAVFTGLGRLEDNRHYLSDVIAGAAIGLVAGRAVVDQRRRDTLLSHLVVSDGQAALAWRF